MGSDAEKSPTFWEAKKKSPTFWDADLVVKVGLLEAMQKKARLLGMRRKKARLFGMQIWLVKVGLLSCVFSHCKSRAFALCVFPLKKSGFWELCNAEKSPTFLKAKKKARLFGMQI